MAEPDHARYVSRAGVKLAFGLSRFNIDPAGLICADLGSNVGGFVDCLLRRGARKVYAVDTGYGLLDWSLRNEPRVVVMERTNALRVVLEESVQLVTVDVGWTPQHLILPRALDLLGPGAVIVSLIKPHYEADSTQLRGGVLPDECAERALTATIDRLTILGIRIDATVESPIRGGGGNREWLALVNGSPTTCVTQAAR